MKYLHFSFILIITCSTVLYASSIHYYDLKQRPAAEVIPLVQPFLESGEVINGEGYQLFIKATPARAKEIEGLIANIDQSLDTFKVSVSNDQSLLQARQSVSGSARLESGDTSVQVGKQKNKDSSVEIRASSSSENKHSGQTQTLQVQEGKPAYISTADLRIIPVRNYPNNVNGEYVTQEIYPVSQDGFLVTVRSADKKTANVSIQSATSNKTDRPVYHGYGQEQTYLDTTLQVPMGRWFEIGGINERSNSSSSEILSRSSSNKQTGNSIVMKIELLN